MANDIDKTSPHYKGEFGSIYEVNQKFPSGGVEGDYVAIDGWAHYWNADRGTWCVNAQRDSYWDELITNIIEHFKTIKGATYMGVATADTVPDSSAAKMFYFALQGGKYANFGNQDVAQGINVLLTEDGKSWTVQSLISVAQELGASTTMLVSQKAITDAINRKANTADVDEALAKKADKETVDTELAKKANSADVTSQMQTEQTRVNTELAKKFDKESVAQESGNSEVLVMSQKAVSDKLSNLSNLEGEWGDGYYNEGKLIENYQPETYRHVKFYISKFSSIIVSCTNVAVDADSIVLLDKNEKVLKFYKSSDTGKKFSDFLIEDVGIASYVIVNAEKRANAKVCCKISYLQKAINDNSDEINKNRELIGNNSDTISKIDKNVYITEKILEGEWGDGYYNEGKLIESYQPETYRHKFFNVNKIDKAKISCTNVAVDADGIVLLDKNEKVLSYLSASETGKIINNYELSISDGVYYVAVNCEKNANAYVSINTSGLDNKGDEQIIEQEVNNGYSHLGFYNMAFAKKYDYALMVAYGQSFAQGGASQGCASLESQEGNFMLDLQTISTEDVDDYSNIGLVPLKAKSVNKLESPIISMTNSFSALYRQVNSNQKFIAISGGKSGEVIENIMPGTEPYNRFKKACQRISEIASQEGKSVGVISILMMQGESNYFSYAKHNKSEYKIYLMQLISSLKNDLKEIFSQEESPSVLLYQTGYKWLQNYWELPISQAQLELSQEIPEVILTNPVYPLTFNESNHPNYNGYRWFGEYATKALWNAMQYNFKYETVKVKSIAVINDNTIKIDVFAPVPPIRLNNFTNIEIKDYGFEVKLNGEIATIDSLKIHDNCIFITLEENLIHKIIEITYAGINRDGGGNICDSDKWLSMNKYVEDDENSKYNSSTLTYAVTKRPKDEYGNNIFGSVYPMENWLTNFYYNFSFHLLRHYIRMKQNYKARVSVFNMLNFVVKFSSSNNKVCTVDNQGNISAVGIGSAYITASVLYKNKTYIDNCAIVVD